MTGETSRHFVLLLHAGDYLDATRRRAEGQADRYRHHSYALDSLNALRSDGARVTVIQLYSPTHYDEIVDGVRFLGLAFREEGGPARLERYLRAEQATHVMLRTPSVLVLRSLVSMPMRISVVLADSFPSPLRHRARYRELGRLLSHPQVDFVSNHHVNSSQQLVDVLGLDPARVVPWDWPLDLLDLALGSAKTRVNGKPVSLTYVGSLDRSKGVWDLLSAMALLRNSGVDVTAQIAGAGQVDQMWALVDKYELRDRVTFHGRVGGDDVVRMMRNSTFVCVPSRHSYPEGLPLTIYEAMASGTPLIASSHPMFAGVVRDGDTGFVFRAGHPRRLAAAVRRGIGDVAVYAHVSRAATVAYADLGLDTLWGDIVRRWGRGTPADIAWLREVALDGGTR